MARTKTYGHYCAAARTLEIVGDKWSLLTVRDLLFGPQRFSDLLRSLGGITPKLLTARLRELEASGVIARDQEAGRREVWYQLTPAGWELRPVIESLLIWGLEHGPPPKPGETINPRRAARTAATVLNRRETRPEGPVVWALDFAEGETHTIWYDGERWTALRDASPPPDLMVRATVAAWIRVLRATPDELPEAFADIGLDGESSRVAEFKRVVGRKRVATAASSCAIGG